MGFGKRVIGEEAWEVQEAAAKVSEGHAGFGARVTGPLTPTVEEPATKSDEGSKDDTTSSGDKPDSKDVKTTTPLSVAQMKKALVESDGPAFFDEVMEAEFARAEGPRKGGLRLLLKSEQDRDESREAIVAELTQALKV